MNNAAPIPLFPPLVARLLAPLPAGPLSLALGHVARTMAARHPGLFARLGPHAEKRFLIDPTDLPFCFLIWPTPSRPRIEVRRSVPAAAWDSRIAGPLAALLGMVHGAYDGDALFFSRDIVIEGDTEAALALRNAIDDAEIDLFTEAAASLGAMGRLAGQRLHPLARTASRITGVALTRTEETA
ncbi:MAG: SCP2 sterol-binding domain-containing protein [Proteobacteria bacterium]|nr:SCP2 sterol-binding domain-containing protein [Pseudomonadota bacterium]